MARAFKETPAVVKIRPTTHASLQEISRDENRSMGEIISQLVERYERERFWNAADKGLRRLNKDDAQSLKAETRELDQLANDGLDNEPSFFTEEEEEEIRAEIASESRNR